MIQITLYIALFVIKSIDGRTIDQYSHRREQLIQEEIASSLGGRIVLNNEEKTANGILMYWKNKEIDESFHNPAYFNFSRHYFTYKKYMETSKVYQIVRKMPKGAALHVHSSAMLHEDNLLQLTYEDHLYACYTNNDLSLRFSDTVPVRPCPVKWSLLTELRNASGDVTAFDQELKKHLTMYTENVKDFDSDINNVWKRFNQVYTVVKSLIGYRPVREKFFYAALKNFYNDNVMYVEIRSGLHQLHELNGTLHDKMYLAQLYRDVASKFKEDYPDFQGVKLIMTRHRTVDLNQLREALDVARQLKRDMPKMFAGFDLVGQEDLGKPLIDFLPELTKAKNEMDFFFHGGETNWYGTPTDENLFDAILLGAKRIGHAYALVKHPSLLVSVKQKDIALEVNVISNAVLALVRDVRNHPLATYLALGLPVVLSSDDPGSWGAAPLSHDFYVAFVAVANLKRRQNVAYL
ncbi:hypothetical protein O3G_MSEX009680 [Manduca sexta]|uniref:Adenosine deaminase n=1 Tax=Manduca sexta TaxID=7130 RepID=A0A921ZEJ9_MANSE|nr:hypothetical protein O3G_MSEX009680 [Manduca sexta]KAG6456359.1 hypothetical protein O3G_MSEX009680 [Manduca sexta]